MKVLLFINLILLFFHNSAFSFDYEPKEIAWLNGKEFKITTNTKILVDDKYDLEIKQFTEMLKQIADYNNRIIKIEVQALSEKNIRGNIIIGGTNTPIIKRILQENSSSVKHNEGYIILITEENFVIAFNSRRALQYALTTVREIILMSHIKIIGKNIYLAVPCLKIVDYPSFDIRAVHATLFDTLDQIKIKELIDNASRARFNTLILAINNGMKFDSHPEISKKNAFTKEQILELIRYAKERHLEVIPHIDLLGHQEWLLAPAYPEFILKGGILRDSPNMFLTYNPKNPKVYQIIFEILDEIIEVFKPQYIHIGHDEAFGIRVFNEPESYQLFAQHINKINEFLSKKGIKVIIWGDMLRKDHNGSEKNIYKAVDLISRDIIICNWYYKNNDFSSFDYFTNKGFSIIAATFKDERTIQKLSNYLKNSRNNQLLGVVATTWYYLPWGKKEMLYRLIEVSGRNFW